MFSALSSFSIKVLLTCTPYLYKTHSCLVSCLKLKPQIFTFLLLKRVKFQQLLNSSSCFCLSSILHIIFISPVCTVMHLIFSKTFQIKSTELSCLGSLNMLLLRSDQTFTDLLHLCQAF